MIKPGSPIRIVIGTPSASPRRSAVIDYLKFMAHVMAFMLFVGVVVGSMALIGWSTAWHGWSIPLGVLDAVFWITTGFYVVEHRRGHR